ncbi:MAG: hypothetical protein MI975_27605 [Cytophagales bacterium]|nr:hypothetical protein [Cytophagales bacterium]
MKSKSLGKAIKSISLAFILFLSVVSLFVSFIFFKSDITDIDIKVASYVYLVGGLLFIPFVFIISIKKKKKESKVLQYMKGGFFVLRLIVLVVLVFLFMDAFPEFNRSFHNMFPTSSFHEKNLLIFENMIEDDKRDEISLKIFRLYGKNPNIDYARLTCFSLKQTLIQTQNDLNNFDKDEVARNFTRRLKALNDYDTLLRTDFVNYTKTLMADYIPKEEMSDLLSEYMKLSLVLEMPEFSDFFFRISTAANPDNPKPYLFKGKTIYNQNKLKDAAYWYSLYTEKMKKAGKEKHIPKKIKRFMELELYGDSLHKKLYEKWFNDQPQEMFDYGYWDEENQDSLLIGGKIIQWYVGNSYEALFGPTSLDNSCGLSGCIAEILDLTKVKKDTMPFKQLSGIMLYSYKTDAFNYMNPEFIKWARLNLIPSPDLTIHGYTCQRVYDVLLKFKLRTLKVAHMILELKTSIYGEAGKYETRMYDNDFYGPGYLNENYLEIISDYSSRGFYVYPEDIGFWLRRVIDGSYEECLTTIDEILKRYDPDFTESFYAVFENEIYSAEEYYDEEEYYEGD